MGEVTRRRPYFEVAVPQPSLMQAVARNLEQLAPDVAKITCNNTRVDIEFAIGSGAQAKACIDVDPVNVMGVTEGSRSKVQVNLRIFGDDVSAADTAEAAVFFDPIDQAVDQAIEATMAAHSRPDMELG